MASHCDSVLTLLSLLHHDALQLLSDAADCPLQGLQQGGRKLRLPNRWQRKLREIDTCAAWARHISTQKVSAVIGDLKKVIGESKHGDTHKHAQHEQVPQVPFTFGPSSSTSPLPEHAPPREQARQVMEKFIIKNKLFDKKKKQAVRLDTLPHEHDQVGAHNASIASVPITGSSSASEFNPGAPRNVQEFLWKLHQVLTFDDGINAGLAVDAIGDNYARYHGFKFNIASFLVVKNDDIVGALKRTPHIFSISPATSSCSAIVLPVLGPKTTFQQWQNIDNEYKRILKLKKEQASGHSKK